MKFRFVAALLIAALSITALTGCAAEAAPAQPVLTVTESPQPPLAPVPEPVLPTNPTQPNRISREEAIAIALKDAGFTEDQVTRLHADFDWDDGRPEYEVDFHRDGYEYDYEIHAETGAILRKDKDRED